MDLQASGTEDIASNVDVDPDIAAFDTDLPAEHNVINIFISFLFFLSG